MMNVANQLFFYTEYNCNYQDINDLILYLGCWAPTTNIEKTGRWYVDNKKSTKKSLRPLKVELSSVAERDQILKASYLIKNIYRKSVFVSQWLSSSELVAAKALRQIFQKMNVDCGEREIAIIKSNIMKRDGLSDKVHSIDTYTNISEIKQQKKIVDNAKTCRLVNNVPLDIINTQSKTSK